MNRGVEIAGFLAQQKWNMAHQEAFAADFSPRRYARMTHPDGRHAILMDADPDQKTPQFVAIAKLLHGLDILTPEIYAADPHRGLVLMQDFGSRNFGQLLDGKAEAAPLYRRAIDTLAELHQRFDVAATHDLDLPVFDAALFAGQAELFLDHYIPHIQNRQASEIERETFRQAWLDVLQPLAMLPQSLMLRDFMPDNLMDVDGKTGLLDFQDAGIGPIAYDIASLCETVRRDGGIALLDEMIAHYHRVAQPALSYAELHRACIILAAQRHTRILGILVRIAQKTGQRDKLNYIPRVKQTLDELLRHDALEPVQKWVEWL